jgi:hypothetical protein
MMVMMMVVVVMMIYIMIMIYKKSFLNLPGATTLSASCYPQSQFRHRG